MITQYEHHGALVSVEEANKGKHREHCLCFQGCKKFTPTEATNCKIAVAVYTNCVKFNIVTPVWECPEFEPTA